MVVVSALFFKVSCVGFKDMLLCRLHEFMKTFWVSIFLLFCEDVGLSFVFFCALQ